MQGCVSTIVFFIVGVMIYGHFREKQSNQAKTFSVIAQEACKQKTSRKYSSESYDECIITTCLELCGVGEKTKSKNKLEEFLKDPNECFLTCK